MATFDQLSDQQRAIIELILQRGQTYEELAEKLGLPENRVRTLARDALVELAPVTAKGVEDDWRGQLADYVLGQQAGPESTATRGHLRRSEAARSWTRSLLDSLDTLYANGMPAIPDGGGGRRGRESRDEPAPAAGPKRREPSRPLGPDARRTVFRRRLAAAAGVVAVILVVVLLLPPIGLLTGGDDESGGGGATEQASSGTGEQASNAAGTPAGVAVVAQQDGKRQVVVQAANLDATTEGQAYEVWLYNSPQDAKSMGAQVTNDKGQYQGAGPLPSDYAKYKFVDISLEPIDNNSEHSGKSVLRGEMPKLKKPPANLKPGTPASLGQVVLLPPRGG
jgi:Anti-sigma-K factor rskA/Sigma-70, region 4